MRAHSFLVFVISLVALAIAAMIAATSARADALPPEASRYRREYVRIVRSEWGLQAPVASLAAQIHAESGWNCSAISPVGARGCAQFMPTTAAWIGEQDRRLAVGDVYSPAWAFRAQAVYMHWIDARVKAIDPCERMAFALSAYNGGLGYVYRRQKLSREPGRCLGATCGINPGISPDSQRENARYPVRILLELEPRYAEIEWGPGSCR